MQNRRRYRTGRFRALAHVFAIETDNAALVLYLDGVLEALAEAGDPGHLYTITTDDVGCVLALDGGQLVGSPDPSVAIAHLMWHVNRAAAASTGLAILHAGAAAAGDRAVLLPADSEAGKSTLVAGLARAGLRYLSDELAAVDPFSLRVHAYAKPLALDPGSWSLLADLEPVVDPALRALLPDQWYVQPAAFGTDAVAATAQPVLLVFPQYDPHADHRLEPLSKIDALMAAAARSVSLDGDPQLTLTTLGRVVERCRSYRLTSHDLDAAVDTVMALLHDETVAPTLQTG